MSGDPLTVHQMEVIDWLLDSDPALRWQVMRDLLGASDEEVVAVRARVASEGWGALLLSLQADDGHWDGGVYRPGWVDRDRPFFDAWTATHFSLMMLRILGAEPIDTNVRGAVEKVRDRVSWGFVEGDSYFDGESEPCINGEVIASGAYFGEDVAHLVERVVAEQLTDGGWNCDAEDGAIVSSFHTTICVLDGLLEWERQHGPGEVSQVRRQGEEYLLERRLFKRLSNGQVADPRFTMMSFPYWWYYDVLRGLDYFREASLLTGEAPDPRLDQALDMIADKRTLDGRWRQENRHQGAVPFRFDTTAEGAPSYWNTLRALRVLAWSGRSDLPDT